MCLPVVSLTGSDIVESNPGKFRLGETELKERKDFVERTRKSVQVKLPFDFFHLVLLTPRRILCFVCFSIHMRTFNLELLLAETHTRPGRLWVWFGSQSVSDKNKQTGGQTKSAGAVKPALAAWSLWEGRESRLCFHLIHSLFFWSLNEVCDRIVMLHSCSCHHIHVRQPFPWMFTVQRFLVLKVIF